MLVYRGRERKIATVGKIASGGKGPLGSASVYQCSFLETTNNKQNERVH